MVLCSVFQMSIIFEPYLQLLILHSDPGFTMQPKAINDFNIPNTVVSIAFLSILAIFLAGCAQQQPLKRTAVNPWEWGAQYRMNQGEIIEGGNRTLYMAGQAAVDANLNVMHAGDIRAQLHLAFDNMEAVLDKAGMELSDVVHVVMYTTDVDQTLANWDVYVERVDRAGIQPPLSLIGVAQLALPGMMVEIEATAIQ
jgi:enamine deaminase RidA (YjgF/YER057c/UK114 family)